jgi:hypothetical protein
MEAPTSPRPECALCSGAIREATLAFTHRRGGEKVNLQITLCGSCGDRLEKHLKRAIPKRLFDRTPAVPGDGRGSR